MAFLSVTYQVLFHPLYAFRQLASDQHYNHAYLLYALFYILLVWTLGALFSPLGTTGSVGLTLFMMVLLPFLGVLLWLFTGVVFTMLAYGFNAADKQFFQRFLMLLGFCGLPWVLLPVVFVLKNVLGFFGPSVMTLGSLALWLWTAALFLCALQVIFRLTVKQLVVVAVFPFFMMSLAMTWVLGALFNVMMNVSQLI